MNEVINRTIMRFSRRAERVEREKLVETFVDVGPLFTLLSSPDHQVIYGRRGTGKTHALIFLAESVEKSGDVAIYLDARTIGSSSGMYGEQSHNVSQRATRLLLDLLATLHAEFFRMAFDDNPQREVSPSLLPALNKLTDAFTNLRVDGPIEHHEKQAGTRTTESGSELGLEISASGAAFKMGGTDDQSATSSHEVQVIRKGAVQHHLHFGAIGSALNDVCTAFKGKRIWILLDEWSSIPTDLQPYVADMLRRSVFPNEKITVKIGAIEQRSRFQLAFESGDYVGIELGADAAADVDLDDFMVFDNDADRAVLFFKRLIYSHFIAECQGQDVWSPKDPDDLVGKTFTQASAFEEFVMATEGVPRDALNIISGAAQKAFANKITKDNVRASAKVWYGRDKAAVVNSNPLARRLLNHIIDKVIAHRRARGFLLLAGVRHELIDELFDVRVLHVLKRGISSRDNPGERYDAYKIDYGCYVDLLTTDKAPKGLFPIGQDDAEELGYIEVPPDDYRAIRRAILDIESFDRIVGLG